MSRDHAQHILTAAELSEKLDQHRSNGKTIVCTNGVFDFLHTGHIKYLEASAKCGDIFVIALNSDASTSRIKGPSRPINKEGDRAYVLSALRCVDYVTIFEEDTAENIINIIKPSIYTKGGDYDPEKIPEGKVIKKNGGKIQIIQLEDGYSNSKQFKKISKAAEEDEFKRPDFLAG